MPLKSFPCSSTNDSQLDEERLKASSATQRVKELEASLEDVRRRLLEEKDMKANFEDLLTAMREEIEGFRNERDNLRDEVVPRLRARLEGLESDATGKRNLEYENSRMQQEIQGLRNENANLVNNRKLQLEMQQHSARFTTMAGKIAENSIAEEGAAPVVSPRTSLSRSASVAQRSTNKSGGLSRSASLSRSNSVTGRDREARESLSDRVKDIEMQRDALHRALKSLLERQTWQARENEKRVRELEMERDQATQASSPRRKGFEKEVRSLRAEINHLRQRRDDALEQKWQCEKGLGGLKMDLDRAEQETNSLRSLLQENDISVPFSERMSGTSSNSASSNAEQVTSSSLERAYRKLEEETHLAESNVSGRSLEEEQRLAAQLQASTERTELLASQVRQQLDTNSALRNRLAEAIERGESAQKASAARINSMQGQLRKLEDTVVSAQQHSEEAVARHEDELREVKESHNQQLLRFKSGLRSPGPFSPRSPLSPMSKQRSPRLINTTSGFAQTLNEALRTEFLEKKVQELETALRDAESGMQEVVSRMNMAQIEVMELQSDR